MTTMNMHTCSMHEKVGQIQPLSKFCRRLINPSVHMAFRLYMCIWILFLCFLTYVYVLNRSMERLQQTCTETSSQIRASFHYGGQLEVLIWDQLNMFGTFQGVTSEVVMFSNDRYVAS